MANGERVQAALDRLADTLGAVGVWGRLPYIRAALGVMSDESADRDLREVWRCIRDLCQALDDEETGPPADAASVAGQGE